MRGRRGPGRLDRRGCRGAARGRTPAPGSEARKRQAPGGRVSGPPRFRAGRGSRSPDDEAARGGGFREGGEDRNSAALLEACRLEAAGRKDEARRIFESVVRDLLDSRRALYNLALTFDSPHRLRAAKRAYERLLSLLQEMSEREGLPDSVLGRLTRALRSLRKLVRPNPPDLHEFRGFRRLTLLDPSWKGGRFLPARKTDSMECTKEGR